MIRTTAIYDVFVAYDRRDAKLASSIAEALRSFDLTVFLDAEAVESGSAFEDAIWEAMSECVAVVAVVPEDGGTSWMAFELGAARAWNKPVYAIVSGTTLPRMPAALHESTIWPTSRIDEVARTIVRSADPISDEDKRRLAEAYLQIETTVDQLAIQPRRLAELVKVFNLSSGRRMSGEQVMRLLLTLRKRQQLPPLKKGGDRRKSSAT